MKNIDTAIKKTGRRAAAAVLAAAILAAILIGALCRTVREEAVMKVRYDGQERIGAEAHDYDSGSGWASRNDFFMEDAAMAEISGSDLGGQEAPVTNGIAPVPEDGPAPERHGGKIAMTYDYKAETTDYDGLYGQVADLLDECGGYIESSWTDRRSYDDAFSSKRYSVRKGEFDIRIPADEAWRLRELLDAGEADLYQENASMSDRTGAYLDAETRLRSLEAEYGRLEELLPQAESVSDTIAIQDRLSALSSEMDAVAASMQEIDESVAMSTARLTLYEVLYYRTEVKSYAHGFGERMAEVFEDFLYALPEFLFMLVFLAGGGLVVIGLGALLAKTVLKMAAKRKGEQVIRIVDGRGDQQK